MPENKTRTTSYIAFDFICSIKFCLKTTNSPNSSTKCPKIVLSLMESFGSALEPTSSTILSYWCPNIWSRRFYTKRMDIYWPDILASQKPSSVYSNLTIGLMWSETSRSICAIVTNANWQRRVKWRQNFCRLYHNARSQINVFMLTYLALSKLRMATRNLSFASPTPSQSTSNLLYCQIKRHWLLRLAF